MPNLEETTPRLRRSIIVRTLLRALLTATLLVVLYYVVPMDTALDTHTVLLLIVCLAVFTCVVTWRLRQISGWAYRGLRAINTLPRRGTALHPRVRRHLPYLAARDTPAAAQRPLPAPAPCIGMTMFSTVGSSDITAETDAARLIVTAQIPLDLILLGFAAGVVLGAVDLRRQRQAPRKPQ